MNTFDTNVPLQTRGAWRPALAMSMIALLGFGGLYSLAATGIGSGLFPSQATGSIVMRNGKPVASLLVAQPFAGPRYLQPRPSAANYDPMAAAGSNQARTNPDAVARIALARATIAARDGIAPAAVASDLITQSGSGLDPHISAPAAEQQVARIARARGIPAARVRDAVAQATQSSLGSPVYVNVVVANLALDDAVGQTPAPVQ